MSNPVIIKSNPNGLVLIMDPDLPFETLLAEISAKFGASARFFKNATLGLTLKGRTLSHEEERQIIDTVTEAGHFQVACMVDDDPQTAEHYHDALLKAAQEDPSRFGEFYRGSLNVGQTLESDQSVIVLGDVNPGATVISAGNIVVLGSCFGRLHAGSNGDTSCFAAALTMKASEVRIAHYLGRSAITKRYNTGSYGLDPKLIYIKDDHMKFEFLSVKAFADFFRA